MALTLGITGMDGSTEAEVRTAFKVANAETGGRWTLADGDDADFVVVDMDSLYGPMSWLRLHAAGRRVIGLSSMERVQTDYRLPRPVEATQLAVLLTDIATDAPQAQAPEPAPVHSTPAPAPADELPPPPALQADEEAAAPDIAPAMAGPAEAVEAAPAAEPEPDPEPEAAVAPAEPEPAPTAEPEPAPQDSLPPDRPLAAWLGAQGLERRVRLQRGDGPVLLLDPRSRVWHGPAALKPLAPYFEGTLRIEDFEAPDAASWEGEAATIGAAQPLARLQWLGGLLSNRGALAPGHDPDGKYRLLKWPQTEREYPKHFRIATAMMKGPATVAEIAEASGVDRGDVADFVNANLATGYAESADAPAPEPVDPAPKAGGLFGRMRGR
ncbi:MAG TPA: hypothetical protein VL251_04505 [Thermomonas sp.]|nr:hypothetical protein [Thermomonas sp.]